MNYHEIVSQVVRRMGWAALENSLKSDIQQAISWSESEILDVIGEVNQTKTYSIVETKAEYDIMNDIGIQSFSAIKEVIIYDANGVPVRLVEANSYDEWLRWNPVAAQTEMANDTLESVYSSGEARTDSARLSSKVLYCVHYVAGDTGESSGYFISIKPALTGTLLLVYSVIPAEDIFDDLETSPIFAVSYHRYIVPGAVFYLSQIEYSRLIRTNPQEAQLFADIMRIAKSEFNEVKRKAIEKSKQSTGAAIVKPFVWYDDAGKYR